jgi:hypothetical protein
MHVHLACGNEAATERKTNQMKHIKGLNARIEATTRELSKFGLDAACKFIAVGSDDREGNIWGGGATREECEDDLVRGLKIAGEDYRADAFSIFPLEIVED